MGFRIREITGHGTGAVYPALEQLMNAGVIRDEWETPPPASRPRRRFYHAVYGPAWYQLNGLLDPAPPPASACTEN